MAGLLTSRGKPNVKPNEIGGVKAKEAEEKALMSSKLTTPTVTDTQTDQLSIAPITTDAVDTPILPDIEAQTDVKTTPLSITPPVETDKDQVDVQQQTTDPATNIALNRLQASMAASNLATAQRLGGREDLTAGAKAALRATQQRDAQAALSEATADLAVAEKQNKLEHDAFYGYDKIDPETGETIHIMGTSEINDLIANTTNDQNLLNLQDQGSQITSTAITGYIELMKSDVTDVDGDGKIDVNDWLNDPVFVKKVEDWWKFSGDGGEWTGSDVQVASLNSMLNAATTTTIDKNINSIKKSIGYDLLSPDDKTAYDEIFDTMKSVNLLGGDFQDIKDADGNIIGKKLVDLATGNIIGEEIYYEGHSADEKVDADDEDETLTAGDITYNDLTGNITIVNDDGEVEDITETYDPKLVDDAFHTVSNMVIEAGREANPELYDIVLQTQKDAIRDAMVLAPSDKKWLKDLDITEDSPAYQAILDDTSVETPSDGAKYTWGFLHEEDGKLDANEFDADNKSSEERDIFSFFEGKDIDDGSKDEKFLSGDMFKYDGKVYVYDKAVIGQRSPENDYTRYYFYDAITGEKYFVSTGASKGKLNKA